MNLEKMFQAQRPLREKIIKCNNLEGKDLIPNLILALLVELGELANCWRGFKHWSNNKEMQREKALEEYADCLSFALELGIELNFSYRQAPCLISKDVGSQITDLFYKASHMRFFYEEYGKGCGLADCLDDLFCSLLGLGHLLGFSPSEIEQAYFVKNAINHERQDNGY